MPDRALGVPVPESGELVVVSFGNATGARIGGFWGLGLGGIADNDAPASSRPGPGDAAYLDRQAADRPRDGERR